MATVTVNGNDLESLGYSVIELDGWAGAMELQYRSSPVAGVLKQYKSQYPTVAPRVVNLKVMVTASTVASRGAALDALLGYFPMDSELSLSFADDTSKVLYGYVTKDAAVSVLPSHSFAIPDLIAAFEITCYDPRKWDATNTTIAVTNTLVTIPVGTIETGGIFTIAGAATTPVLTYADGSGNTVSTQTWSTALASGDTLAIDLDLLTAVKTYSTGTVSNVLSSWTAGDWFKFDPADKDAEVGPKLKVSSGEGELVYKRKWRS